MTENLNLLCILLLVYGLLGTNHNKKMLWFACVANILLFLLKPNNYYMFSISFAFLSFYSESKRRDLLRLTIPYVLVVFVYVLGFSMLKLSHPGLEGMSAVFQGIRAVAYKPYQEGFNIAYGKANKELLAAVSNNEILLKSNGANYNKLTQDLVDKYGKTNAELILLKASAEVFLAKPSLAGKWAVNLYSASSNNYTGQMLFYPFMIKAASMSEVSADNGPATAQLLRHLRNYIHKREHIWSSWEQPMFRDFAGEPDKLLTNIFHQPNHVYHWFIWQALDREIGPTDTSKLFMAAAIEGFRRYPGAMQVFLFDLWDYFVGPDLEYASGTREVKLPNAQLGSKNDHKLLTPLMREQIKSPLLNVSEQKWQTMHEHLGKLWLNLKPLIFCMALLSLVITMQTRLWPAVALMWMISIYNALIVTIFADPFFRFSVVSWVLSLIMALQAIFFIVDKVREFKLAKTAMVNE